MPSPDPQLPEIPVLVLDREGTWIDTVVELASRFTDERFRVHGVSTRSEAEQALLGERFPVALIDIRIDDGSGIDVVRFACSRSVPTAVILVTSQERERELEVQAVMAGASDLLYREEINEATLRRVLHMGLLRHAAELQLRDEVNRDALTGLYSRHHLENSLDLELQRHIRHQDQCSVLLIDLDDFRHINESFGHAAGDSALKAVARAISSNTRDIDIVGRFGGDRFLALLPQTGSRDAMTVGRKILKDIRTAQSKQMDGLSLTASIGIASTDQDILEHDGLLEAAGRALRNAKESGKNQVSRYEPESG